MDHLHELRALVVSGSADSFIGIDSGVLPFLVGFDEVRVILDLIAEGFLLLLVLGGHSAIGTYLELFGCVPGTVQQRLFSA